MNFLKECREKQDKMKTLNPKIVKKLSEGLGILDKTVKKDIYNLSKNYPQATKNAIAQIYASNKGISIFRMLDKDDKATLASQPKEKSTYNIKQYKTPLQKQRWYQKEWMWAIIAVLISIVALLK